MEQIDARSIQKVPIVKIYNGDAAEEKDILAVEEPLEIRLSFFENDQLIQKSISVTMRTPGNDEELALGFLFTEGIITSFDAIEVVAHTGMICEFQKQNILQIQLKKGFYPNLNNTERNFYTSSSCGVCGKGSIDAIRTVTTKHFEKETEVAVSLDLLYQLPQLLRNAQQNFSATGGIHASGLFDTTGNLLYLREDVGRHNALDKLIGEALMAHQLPLNNQVLLLSGRASFELIQKAAMAGIKIIAAIGAPSSLAVDLAKEFDITLVGFLRDKKCNIYHANERILISELKYEN
ncbi:formate dehydrogenase accessory sulfurtransferase FdhD [Rhizosphaericola mali]|uniref:Sulfur carrier protein FdhD n=1 Tax=Rhizosphaericola mali TaxID=2545455 RepID=A0A5P2FZK7_9BACT|nr:formate dehydrogenase accessory sulfurtransferase FdhD [Rhizosphaericola mali]QES88387.1 formate dehydrogenase accessory sulfurtransferase FdhD [Rhizosphaericola mali]